MNNRLKRAESFVGIHFDFHARDENTGIGRHTTSDSVNRVLDATSPDYVEVDCKGHHGISSYPTRVGNAAPGIVGDPLRVWREVTASRGVALYVHYSGVQDAKAVFLHPDWARVDSDGAIDKLTTSLYGGYVDDLMLPQLKELIQEYDIDGVWVDGDAWGARLDYSPAAISAFAEATGSAPPRNRNEPLWLEFAEFQREAYLRYLRHYTDELHGYRADFQVGSAWAFSSFLPRPVSASVDYLSGDTSAINHNFARLEGRLLEHQGLPWDLMTWSFGGHFELDGPPPAVSLKSVAQLRQEAATIISLGGGYQTVSNQQMDGSVAEWQLPTLGAVADFCRERAPWVRGSKSRSEVAILHSTSAFNRRTANLMNALGELDPLLGCLEALLDSQLAVDVIMEHQLRDRLPQYRLLIVPEWSGIDPQFEKQLRDWVMLGGKLLVIGADATEAFLDLLGVRPGSSVVADSTFWVEGTNSLAGVRGARRPVEVDADGSVVGTLFSQNDYSNPEIAATANKSGDGIVAGIFFNFGEYHHAHPSHAARQFLASVINFLLPLREVTVHGSQLVDLIVRDLPEGLAIHLINTAGQQRDLATYTFDEIPPIGPLEIRVRTDRIPISVTSEPESQELDFSFDAGICIFEIERVDIHSIVVIQHERG